MNAACILYSYVITFIHFLQITLFVAIAAGLIRMVFRTLPMLVTQNPAELGLTFVSN